MSEAEEWEGKERAQPPTQDKPTFICSWAAPESASSPLSAQDCGISQIQRTDLCPSAENKTDKAGTKGQRRQRCEEGRSIS